jgi:hypothetical protein
MIGFNGEDLTQLSWPSWRQFCERRDLFARLFSITAIPWSAWNTVTTKRFNSREHTGLYTKRKLNWNWEWYCLITLIWHFFWFAVPQNSFSYIWDFSYKGFAIYKFFNETGGPSVLWSLIYASLNDWVIKIQALYPHSLNVYDLCSLKDTIFSYWVWQVSWVVR